MKYENGYINLEKVEKVCLSKIYEKNKIFLINGKKYFYKSCKIENMYNELIAEEIAHDYGILNAHYDLVEEYGQIGVISKNVFSDTDKVITIEDLLKEFYSDDTVFSKNNLEDIWNCLDEHYKNKGIVMQLMDEIIDVYIFDVLIGNVDRNISNLAIVENKGGIHIGPLFDNENMLDDLSIEKGQYTLGIDEYFEILYDCEYNHLEKFLNMSSGIYLERLKDKLYLVDLGNILNILNRIEFRIGDKIHPMIRKKIISNFKTNLDMINNVLSKIDKKKI